jgi:hypothetical protein
LDDKLRSLVRKASSRRFALPAHKQRQHKLSVANKGEQKQRNSRASQEVSEPWAGKPFPKHSALRMR